MDVKIVCAGNISRVESARGKTIFTLDRRGGTGEFQGEYRSISAGDQISIPDLILQIKRN